MALITCPECGKEISDKAASCPQCGCPLQHNIEEQPTILNVDNNIDLNSTQVVAHKKMKMPIKIVLIVLGVILAICIVLCIRFYSFSGKYKNINDDETIKISRNSYSIVEKTDDGTKDVENGECNIVGQNIKLCPDDESESESYFRTKGFLVKSSGCMQADNSSSQYRTYTYSDSFVVDVIGARYYWNEVLALDDNSHEYVHIIEVSNTIANSENQYSKSTGAFKENGDLIVLYNEDGEENRRYLQHNGNIYQYVYKKSLF